AAQIYTSGEGMTGGSEMAAQVGNAIVVAYGAVRRARIIVASTVLGHIEIRIAILVAQADQPLGKSACVDRPAHRRETRAGRRGAEPGSKKAFRRVPDVHRRIVVDAEIVGGLSHGG